MIIDQKKARAIIGIDNSISINKFGLTCQFISKEFSFLKECNFVRCVLAHFSQILILLCWDFYTLANKEHLMTPKLASHYNLPREQNLDIPDVVFFILGQSHDVINNINTSSHVIRHTILAQYYTPAFNI